MTRAAVIGMGLWIPEHKIDNRDWPMPITATTKKGLRERRRRDFVAIDEHDPERPYDALYAKYGSPHEDDPYKGTVQRFVQLPEIPTAAGDAEAAKRALEEAEVGADEVDIIMSSALVPDEIVPNNGPFIQQRLGCRNAVALGVESLCSAGCSQLELACAMVESGRVRNVLCVQSHQIGRINDPDVPFSVIFGDASSAFVVGPAEHGLIDVMRGGDGSLALGVTHVYKEDRDAVWWRNARGPVIPGHKDFQAAKQITRHSLRYAIDTVKALLEKNSLDPRDVAAFATIQPLVWYQAAIAEGLGVPVEKIPSTYQTYAHIGACGVVANLIEARRRELLRPGAPVVLFAIGAGLTRYAALMHWN